MYASTSEMMPAKPIMAVITIGSGSELAAVRDCGSNSGMGDVQSRPPPKIKAT